MKIKVLFVAPYPAMANLIEECRKEEPELDVHIKAGNLQEGVAFAKRAEAEGFDVIISRGGTAKLIGEAVNLPVIDIHVSGYDMLRVLTLANEFARKKAIVGFANITRGARAIIDLLDIKMDIFTIDHEEKTAPLLERLKQEGYELIMGDVVTTDTAANLGLMGILIQSGREAIFDAFKEAKTVSRWLMKNKLEVERLKGILSAVEKNLIVLTEKGEIVYEQWRDLPSRPDLPLERVINEEFTTDVIDQSESGPSLKITAKKITLHETTYLFCEITKLEKDQTSLESLQVQKLSSPPLVINHSEAMRSCLTMIQRCLFYDHFILLGERGTGRRLMAEYIHDRKFQGSGLFASIQARDMLKIQPGTIQQGMQTLYIYAVDELEEERQTALLQKIASLKGRRMAVILALSAEHPAFRDLMDADDTVRIHLPTLAERKADLRELVTSFLVDFHQTLGTSAIKIKEEGLALLEEYSWSGNVSELKALLKDAVLMEKGYVVEKGVIETLLVRKSGEVPTPSIPPDLISGTLDEIEKKIIEYVLAQEDYNQTKTAKRLNINRSTLWRKLKEE